MQSMTLKIAQRASQDKSLIASLIDTFGERENLSWDEIANQLWIDDHILAKLALCRRPRPAQFSDDIAQISNYAGIDHKHLSRFIRDAEAPPVKQSRNVAAASQTQKPARKFIFSWAFTIILLVILIISAFMFLQPGTAAGTMMVLEGDTTIVTDDNPLSLTGKLKGVTFSGGEVITLKPGDTVIVGVGGYSRLQLQDGTTLELFENTILKIDDLTINEGTLQVRYKILTGKTINRVRRLLDVGDFYEVISPSSTISVRGTVFTVQVLSEQSTYVSCDEGVVQVSVGDRVILLNAGEEVIANTGEEVEPQPQPQSGNQPSPVPPDEVAPAPTNTPVHNSPTIELTATPRPQDPIELTQPVTEETPEPIQQVPQETPQQTPVQTLNPSQNNPVPTKKWDDLPENLPPGQGGDKPSDGFAPPGQGDPPGHQMNPKKTKKPKIK